MGIGYRMLADAVVVVHAIYIAFVVIGFAAILIGAVLKWPWVSSFRFRITHMAAIALVCFESFAGIVCPLTSLEDWLRRHAGESRYRDDFVAYWAHRLIFFDISPSVFTVIYVGFAALVLLTFVLMPPLQSQARRRIADGTSSRK